MAVDHKIFNANILSKKKINLIIVGTHICNNLKKKTVKVVYYKIY